MTESQMWVTWIERMEKGDEFFLDLPGLCLWSRRQQGMALRLKLFCPVGKDSGDYWWDWDKDGIASRATACGFLAAMAEGAP